MTNPNNGATLEDCHSNFFALTDLCGIKWRRLVSDGSMGSGHGHHSYGPLDDPVLSSFAKCLAADILCVWRKSPTQRSQQLHPLHHQPQQHQQQQISTPALTPNDPFHPAGGLGGGPGVGGAPQYMHHPPGGKGSSGPHSQIHLQPPPPHHLPSHLMPPHHHPHMGMGMGSGPGLGPHQQQQQHHHPSHMNVPPPYPSGPHQNHPPHPHSHPGIPQPPSMHNQLLNNVNPTLNGPKELWIFWYGEEPEELSTLVSPQLLKTDSEQGSWENGLNYECRTLLFKALHNLIERCLLARDFVRIDKWFIQPCDDNQRLGLKSFPMQLSFSFSFFLHGESTVCMSVDVRQHPPIRRVNKNHVSACQNQTMPVILAPHGLAGSLTGVGYKLSEPGTHKILEEWKHFYPVEAALKSPLYDTTLPPSTAAHSSTSSTTSPHPVQSSPSRSNNNGSSPSTTSHPPHISSSSSSSPSSSSSSSPNSHSIPPVLEVRVGGVLMRYPSCYVLCTDMDELPSDLAGGSSGCRSSYGVTAPKTRGSMTMTTDSENAACPSGASPGKPQGSIGPEIEKAEGILPERVWQESILCSAKGNPSSDQGASSGGGSNNNNNNSSSSNNSNTSCGPGTPVATSSNSDNAVGQWDFVDPLKKSICTCSKCNRLIGARVSQASLGSISMMMSTGGGGGQMSTKGGGGGGGVSGVSGVGGGAKLKRSSYHRRNPQQLSQLDSWGSLWDLAAGEDVNNEAGGAAASSNNTTTTTTQPPGSCPPLTTGSLKAAASSSSSTSDSQSLTNHSSSTRMSGMPGTPVGGPPSYKAGPGSINSGGGGGGGLGGNGDGIIASPASVAPSPLATPKSQSQPASVPQQEPAMPTLSPQSSSSNNNDSNNKGSGQQGAAGTPDNNTVAPKSVSSLSNQIFSPIVGNSGFDGAKGDCGDHPNLPHGGASGGGGGGGNEIQISQSTTMSRNSCEGGTGGAVAHHHAAAANWKLLRRPVLPSKEYEELLAEEESSQPSDSIYDFSTLQAWLQHPVKRMRSNDGQAKVTMYSWGLGMKKIPEVPPPQPAPPFLANGPHRERPLHLGKRANDPYEFYDEHHQPILIDKGKDDLKEEKSPVLPAEAVNGSKSKNLFTSEGIQPSLRDLDQIFDNSDTSSDETFQAATPPGSNKPAAVCDETTTGAAPMKTKPGLTSLRPEELSKMFPTPPSHEHNPISSPCGIQPDTPSMEGLTGGVTENCLRRPPPPPSAHNNENYPVLGSPPDEPVDIRSMETSFPKSSSSSSSHPTHHHHHHHHHGAGHHHSRHSQDWSFVYKAPAICKMLGSSKYAPLSVLPSQQLPPLNCPLSNATYTPSWQFIGAGGSSASSSSSNSGGGGNPPPPPIPVQVSHHQQQQLHHHQQQQQHHHHPGQHLQMSIHPPLSSSSSSSMSAALAGGMHLMRPGLSPISPAPSAIRGGPPSLELGSPPSSNMYLRHATHHGVVVQQQQHQQQQQQHHLYGSRGPEAHALVVNLSLSDSVINLFRDHNFDSCTMCVCNASLKVVGNIRGSEAGLYIPDSSPDEDPVRCNCGFSASANRRLAHRAGLFYEDEFEVATASYAHLVLPPDEWYERKKPSLLLLDPRYPNTAALAMDRDGASASSVVDCVPPFLLEMLREQCLLFYGSAASRFSGEPVNHRLLEKAYNTLDYLDGNRAALIALEHGRTVMLEARSGFPRMPEDTMPLKSAVNYMHKWPYLWGRGPQSSQDVMQVMRSLCPMMQEAVHSKARDAQYTVSGPLTWRQFHRLAGRGTDDRCEPQPIPSILVGSEKDFVALSPLAIKYWEKLLLEPYAYPRDVAYIVVAPDSDFVLQKVRSFFRELSAVYETCQLGRHCAISKVLRDGILRVGRSAAANLASEPVDDWFSSLPDIPAASTLRLYAQVCRHYLAPQLASISLDQSLLDSPSQSSSQFPRPTQERPTPSPKMPPPSGDPTAINSTSSQGPTTPKSEYESEGNSKELPSSENLDEDERDPPALVVYLVEPFGFGHDNKDLHRMANLGLLRCFASIQNCLPEHIRNNVTLQVVSLEDIMNLGNSSFDSRLKIDQLRHLSLTVYSQCRRHLIHQNNVKSLTGFGPAAAAERFMNQKEQRLGLTEKRRGAYKLFTPPFILAPTKQKVSEGVEWLGGIQGHTIGGMVSSGNTQSSTNSATPQSSVLYVSYCISEDQRWLLASATDDRGELLETTIISIYVPNRSKRRKASARKHGLQKLMDFIVGIMSIGIQPWRLVVGRLGRVGHGELESWSSLLSRKSLLRASNQLKESCGQCNLQFPGDSPCVLSACLVSLEPDSCLRLMPDQFTPDERFGVSVTSTSTSTLSTPQDISCTHILVFPTSATTQSSQTAFQDQHINGPDIADDDLFLINVGDVNDMGDGIDGMQDLQLGDIFGSWEDNAPGVPSPVGSPRRDSASQPGSPGGVGASGRQSPFQTGGQGRSGGSASDDLGTVLQQPLALGYMVSTAPAGQLPNWFWASCPQRSIEKTSGVFLKSALHLHSHSVLHNDDLLPSQSSAKQHPLDSQFTTDVLRFVLEGYNALSWLCLDPKTHDRMSCLPVHIQKLLQLYYTVGALV